MADQPTPTPGFTVPTLAPIDHTMPDYLNTDTTNSPARQNFLQSLDGLIGSGNVKVPTYDPSNYAQFQAPGPDYQLANLFQQQNNQAAQQQAQAPTPSTGNSVLSFLKGLIGMPDEQSNHTLASMLEGVQKGLNYTVGKPLEAGLSVAGDALNGYNNLFNNTMKAVGVPGFNQVQNTDIPNVGQQMKDIYSTSDDNVAQSALDDYFGTPQNLRGTAASPGSQANFLGQMFLSGPEAALAGKGLSLAGKGALEGIGRLPGVSSAADRFAASKAGQSFDAAQAAKSADSEVDPFASAAQNTYDPQNTLQGWNPQAYEDAANTPSVYKIDPAEYEGHLTNQIQQTQNSLDNFTNNFKTSPDEIAQHNANVAELASNQSSIDGLKNMYEPNGYTPPKFDPKVQGSPKPTWASNPLNFESDLDKALYIVGRPGAAQSASHGKFVDFVKQYLPGMADGDIASLANDVHGQIKAQVKGKNYDIPDLGLTKPTLGDVTKDPQYANLTGRNNELQNAIDTFTSRQTANQAAAGMHPQAQSMQNMIDELNQRLGSFKTAQQAQAEAETAAKAAQQAKEAADAKAAEEVTAQERDDHINQVMQQMSPGEKLGDMLHSNIVQPVTDRVSQALFKAGIGSGINRLPDAVRNTILNNRGLLDSNAAKIDEFGRNLATEAAQNGLDKNALGAARYQFETGGADAVKNANAKDLISKLTGASTDAGKYIDGLTAGLTHEQAAGLQPENLLQNYLHLSTEPQSVFRSVFPKKSGVTAGYTNARNFKTAAEAEQAGLKVRDPISSTVDRLRESNKDLRNIELHSNLAKTGVDHGVVSDFPKDGMVKFNSAYGSSPLNGKYVTPELNRFLSGLERTPTAMKDGMVGSLARGYDRLQDFYKTVNLYNPLVHSHNIIGNALMSFGLKPQNYADAELALGGSAGAKIGKSLGGAANPEMQESLKWANQTGALGAQHNNVYNQIGRILNGKNADNLFQRGQNAALWNRERAMRLAVFHQARQDAVNAGLSPKEAANVARDATNQHLADYSANNLSTFEREIASRLDPFYRWHKSNYPMQFSKIASPAAMGRMRAFDFARNAINEGTTGHDQAQNVGDNKQKNINIQIPLGDGKSMSYDMYSPTDDPLKVLSEKPGEFAWNHTYRPLTELLQQGLNNQYAPLGTLLPLGKEYRANTSITNPLDSLGEALAKRGEHAFSAVAPNLLQNAANWAGLTGRPDAVPFLARIAGGATGGFVNPNPISQQSEDAQKKASINFYKKALQQKMREQARGGR